MQHHIVQLIDSHKKRMANLSHKLFEIRDPTIVEAFLKTEVTSLDEARKVIAMLVSAVGQLVRDSKDG